MEDEKEKKDLEAEYKAAYEDSIMIGGFIAKGFAFLFINLLCITMGESCLHYVYGRDINAWQARAQIAASREDMLSYMKNLQQNMEKRGMTKGHTVFIFKKPDNDVGLQYQTVQNIVRRLQRLENADPNGVAYQTAMADLRGIIREMPSITADWIFVHVLWKIMLFIFLADLALIMLYLKIRKKTKEAS